MPLLNCDLEAALDEILTAGCNDKGGVIRMAWADASEIDAVTWADAQISAITFSGGATFSELRIDPENSQFFDEYTRDGGSYEQTALMYFKSLNCDTRDALAAAVGYCPIILAAETAGCKIFIMGIHKRGTGYEIQFPMPLEPTRHRNDAGQMGGDRSRHEFELTGKSMQPIICFTGDWDDLPGLAPQ
jgi:hypothetical protein